MRKSKDTNPTVAGGEACIPVKKAKRSVLMRKENRTALAFISVKYVGLILFTVLPLVIAVFYSLTDYNGFKVLSSSEPFFARIGELWNNFKNYRDLFVNPIYSTPFLNAVKNNLIFMITVPLGIIIGLVTAAMLASKKVVRGSRLIRMLIYMPVVSSAVAMNIIWRYIFDNEYGIVNQLLGTQIQWLTNSVWLKVAIIIKNTWGSIGSTMVLCLAALTNVGTDYYEAADLDGAGEIRKFLKISVPLISPTIFYLFCTHFISNLQAYVDADIFANGAPGGQTVVYFVWSYGIRRSYYGIGAAASVILAVAILIITAIQFKAQDKWVYSG